MRTYPKKFKTLFMISTMFVACSDTKSNKAGPPAGGSVDSLSVGLLIIESKDLKKNAAVFLGEGDDINDCQVNMDKYSTDGACLTPLNLIGSARFLEATVGNNTGPFEAGSARMASISNGAEYDLAKSQEFAAYNELFFNYPYKSTWDYVTLANNYQKITVKIQDKYVTMFVAAFTQPSASWDIWDQCSIPADQRTTSNFNDWVGLENMVFTRGDYLFCVKDSSTATCAASDYQWLDTVSMQLVSTRPSQPRVNKWLTNDKASCTRQGEGRYSASYNPIIFGAKFVKPFKLYSDFSHGPDSVQWPNGRFPFDDGSEASTEDTGGRSYPLYYYQAADSSEIKEGTLLQSRIDFSVKDALFVDGLSSDEVATSSLATVLSNLYTKSDWVFQKKAEENLNGFSANHFSSLSVTASIDISGGRERPTVVEEKIEAQEASANGT